MPEGNWGLDNREGNGLAHDWALSSSVVTIVMVGRGLLEGKAKVVKIMTLLEHRPHNHGMSEQDVTLKLV